MSMVRLVLGIGLGDQVMGWDHWLIGRRIATPVIWIIASVRQGVMYAGIGNLQKAKVRRLGT